METTTISPTPLPTVPVRPLAAVRRYAGQWGLIAALAALPVYYGVHDLVYGYQFSVAGHLVIHHDLSTLGYDFAQGLPTGAIWALIAIGYTLVYGIIELINFAHGDVFMLGSFTAVGLWSVFGLSPGEGAAALIGYLLLALIMTMIVTGSLNVLIERVAYRPLRNAPKLAPLITAVGFSFILQNVGLLWRGGSPQSVPDLIGVQQTVFTVVGVAIQRGYILVFAVMIPLVFALSWFISSTRAGRAMRATAQDPEAARLMGINVNATISLTVLLGIVLPFFFPADSGFMNGTIIAVAYAVMSLGLNIVVGFAGLLDLGYVAFYALGAYSLGWFGSGFFFKLRVHVLVSPIASTLQGIHLNFVLILIGAALICAAAGMLIGLPTLRLRGDYIAIVTLPFGAIIGVVAANGQRGPAGGGTTLRAAKTGIHLS